MPDYPNDAWTDDHAPLTASVATPTCITVTIPHAIPLLHTLRRMSWGERDEHDNTLSQQLAFLVPYDPHRKPFARAHVLIRRFSIGLAGDDELQGAADALVDLLLMMSPINPCGLGLIRSRYETTVTIEAEPVSQRDHQRTVVVIEKVPWGVAL